MSIGGGQFEDSDEEEESKAHYFGGGQSKDMATDYDPPTRYDLNEDLGGMSEATLKLLEREMGLKFSDILSEITQQPRP